MSAESNSSGGGSGSRAIVAVAHRTVEELARAESPADVARRELDNARALIIKEAERAAELRGRRSLLELLTRERRMISAEIADREDAHRRAMRSLTGRLEALNAEIKELRPPPGVKIE